MNTGFKEVESSTRFEKLLRRALGALAVLIVLLSVLALLSDRLINRKPFVDDIQARVSRAIGGRLEFQRLALSFFPRLRLTVHQGSFFIPDVADGTVKSLTIRPRLLPLLTGKFRVAVADVHAPEIEVRRVAKPEEKGPQPFSAADLEKRIGVLLGLLLSKAPGLEVRVNDGRLKAFDRRMGEIEIRDAQARIGLYPDKISLGLACKSNFCESISFDGAVVPASLRMRGNVDLVRLSPQPFLPSSFPPAIQKPGASALNVSIEFKAQGLKTLWAKVRGAAALLPLPGDDGETVARGLTLAGSVEWSGEKTAVSVDELKLDFPPLRMSGTYRSHRSPGSKTASTDVELKGYDVDIRPLRNLVSGLFGKVPAVRRLFDIVRGGRMPAITFVSGGNSLSALADLENMTVQADVIEGRILTPGVVLDLTDVKGSLAIADGILRAKDLEARLGKISARNGTMKLGLAGKYGLFHLDLPVDADLAELHSLLRRMFEDSAFGNELALLHSIEGRAQGRLILGESFESIAARVEVARMNLSAAYGRFPRRVNVKNGGLSYVNDKIELKGVDATAGRSSVSGLFLTLEPSKQSLLEVASEKTELYMDEIFPWLASIDAFAGRFRQLKSLKGVVSLSAMNFRGPVRVPEKWRFQAAGSLRDLIADSAILPGTAKILGGRFTISSDTVSVEDLKADISDGSVKISGTFENVIKGLSDADLTFEGSVGPDLFRRLSARVDLPPQLDVKPPFSISNGRWTWDHRGETKISGDVALQQGVEISADISTAPGLLAVKRLLVRDGESRALFKIFRTDKTLDVSFNGNLNHTTVDRLVHKNRVLTGAMSGDFHSRLDLEHLERSSVRGRLRLQGLNLAGDFLGPLVVEDISVDAEENGVRIETARFSWMGDRFELEGNADFSGRGILLDAQLSGEVINLDFIEQIVGKNREKAPDPTGGGWWDHPVRGALKIRAEEMKYKAYTWRPLQADVAFGDRVAEVAVIEAGLCGVRCPGTLKLSPGALEVNLKPSCEAQDLNAVGSCLFGRQGRVEGKLTFAGELRTMGKADELLRYLGGHFEFDIAGGSFYAGRIHRVLISIFNLLNVTDLFQGQFSGFANKGFDFSSIEGSAEVQNGKINFNEIVIQGKPANIFSRGSIDLTTRRADIIALVAPFKTVDFIVKNIPLVKNVLGGSFVAVPFTIKGPLDDLSPVLSPAAMGSGLLGVMKRTFNLPFQVIEPVFSGAP